MSDPITILGISSLSAVLALIVMGSLARNGIPGTREWFWANGALALGMLLSLDSHAPLFFSILGANLFLCVGAVLQLAGLRRFFRRHSRHRLKAASVLITILAFGYFCFVDNNFAARVVVFSVFHTIYAFALGTTVLLNRPAGRPAYGYVFTIGIGYAAATINIVRGIAYLGGWVPAQGPYVATPLHVLFLAIRHDGRAGLDHRHGHDGPRPNVGGAGKTCQYRLPHRSLRPARFYRSRLKGMQPRSALRPPLPCWTSTSSNRSTTDTAMQVATTCLRTSPIS